MTTTPIPDAEVWMATRRKGLDYHALASGTGFGPTPQSTRCGRSTRTGDILPLSEALALDAKPCKRCRPAT